eukprot:6177524-Pleurochrysis_carterae.AAC.1
MLESRREPRLRVLAAGVRGDAEVHVLRLQKRRLRQHRPDDHVGQRAAARAQWREELQAADCKPQAMVGIKAQRADQAAGAGGHPVKQRDRVRKLAATQGSHCLELAGGIAGVCSRMETREVHQAFLTPS